MEKIDIKKRLILFSLLGAIILNLNAQDLFSVRRLTSGEGQEGFPTWSPDGKSIVYQHTERYDTEGKNGLWHVSADGTDAKQIFSGLAEHPKWSPNGSNIVFDADTGKSIKVIPASGGNPILSVPELIKIQNGGLPCWSPDASSVAFIGGEDLSLCIWDINTGDVARVFKQEGMVPLPGGWWPDGNSVLIALMDRQTRKSTISIFSLDSSENIQIKGHHENFYRHLALSPDGSLLIYAALIDQYLGLYIMSSRGGPSLPLSITQGAHNEGAIWSPDGSKIAFNSTRGNNADIWIMNMDIDKIKTELIKLKK
jgi:Tol biopolymer transport system component